MKFFMVPTSVAAMGSPLAVRGAGIRKLAPPVRRSGQSRAEPFAVERVQMRMRTTVSLAALLLAALVAAPAHAKLVYVKNPASADPVVYTATDNGKRPKRLG